MHIHTCTYVHLYIVDHLSPCSLRPWVQIAARTGAGYGATNNVSVILPNGPRKSALCLTTTACICAYMFVYVCTD